MESDDENPEALTRKVAEVEWIDTHAAHGWTNGRLPSAGLCRSIGYVIKDDVKEIVLAESIDLVKTASRYGCLTAIPKTAIHRVRLLRGKR